MDKLKKPDWLRVRYDNDSVETMRAMLGRLSLNSVCKEANCPNLGECYKNKNATFMILGNICTRHCRFCNVTSEGNPIQLDENEPRNVAKAVKELGLAHVVITCVTRDDLEDYGAKHFAKTIEEIRALSPETSIEILISDFGGIKSNLDIVIEASPEVINHNLETVPRLYSTVRPEADYKRSLYVLEYAKIANPELLTKTGIMVGLGEEPSEVIDVMREAVKIGCDIFTIGQYMPPSREHIELKEYVSPSMFDMYKREGLALGIKYIASKPLVRSSYMAVDAIQSIGTNKETRSDICRT